MIRMRVFLALLLVSALPAAAANRYILRPAVSGDVSTVAGRHGLSVVRSLDDSSNSVYLVTGSDMFTPASVVADCAGDSDITGIEEDQATSVPEIGASPLLNQSTTAILDQIGSRTLVPFFGAQVASYYANQPAVSAMKLDLAQLMVTGKNTVVAVIDTGIDPNHPVLKASVVAGYDFTRDVAGVPNEFNDVSPAIAAVLTQSTTAILDQSTTAILDQNSLAILNQSTTAILDQSTTAILDQSTTAILDGIPAAFGHGTMVAGVVHVAAPEAKIMPLKAFTADGNAQLSDLVRAVYYAADHGATVINMSFSLSQPSRELQSAIKYAQDKGSISVASTGNTGLRNVGHPAAAPKVIGVASTNNGGARSAFSSFGPGTMITAPGEQIITAYPGGHYAAASGTSFSAPLVAGGTALIKQAVPAAGFSNVTKALALRRNLTDLGFGAADILQSILSAKL